MISIYNYRYEVRSCGAAPLRLILKGQSHLIRLARNYVNG
jgi:hypothetical protein